jgi:hypothetical protein
MGADPMEHVRRAFSAVGWVPRIIGNLSWGQHNDQPSPMGDNVEYQDEAFFRNWIVEELHDKSYPMLSFGVLTPLEFGILAGYDEDCDVLVGWHHYQDRDWAENKTSDKVSFEPSGDFRKRESGYFRKRDWFNDTVGLVGFNYKTEKPSIKDTYRSAVEWAVKLARTSKFGSNYSGLDAYTAWAGMLKEDEAFAVADAGVLGGRLEFHNDALAVTWEARMSAVEFLRSGARLLPQWSVSYEEAARCYAAEIGTFEKIANVLGGFGFEPEKAQKLSQAENRAVIVSLIIEARELDERAIEHLEKTLVE